MTNMQVLLKSNIRKACAIVENMPLIEIESGGFSSRPVFATPPGACPTCLQHDYIGFYVLPHAAAGLLRSVNFLVTAKAAMKDRLYGPSVAMAYSAAYATLTAFLALNGRLWIDRPWCQEGNEVGSLPIREKRVMVARLTTANTWIYEPQAQSHKARWRDLVTLFTPISYQIPTSFRQLFSYVYGGRRKPFDDLVDAVFTNPSKYLYDIREKLREFLEEVSEMRHISIYAGFGGDPAVLAALMNRDLFDASLLSLRAEAFVEFAHCFGTEVSRALSSLVNELVLTVGLQEKIGLRMFYPEPFDEPRIDLLEVGELRKNCEYLSFQHAR